MSILSSISAEFKTRNFSIYGQWTGIVCVFLCFALGLSNIITIHGTIIPFAILCLITSFLIIFLEIPLLLRICPTSSKFDEFIRKFHNNWGRAGFYGVASVAQWLSLLSRATSLIAAAVLLLLAAVFYAFAAIKKQDFTGSKTLGGAGIAQMIV